MNVNINQDIYSMKLKEKEKEDLGEDDIPFGDPPFEKKEKEKEIKDKEKNEKNNIGFGSIINLKNKPPAVIRRNLRALNSLKMIISNEDPTLMFDLRQKIGRGSYGCVYKGVSHDTGESVAVKIISLDDVDAIEDVRKEVQMLEQCGHANIVRYYGSYSKDDTLWIVMEFCGGGSVGDMTNVLERGLGEKEIALICRESLKGLEYLHSRYKIHRDIKGGNILLNLDGEIKLADFGVSAQLFNTFSKRNTFAGTPYWMAPEVILENRYDGGADIWSLGVTALELAEMYPPYYNIHPMRVLFMIPREPSPSLKSKEKWSPEFHDFIKQCLIKRPEVRPSASVLLKHPFVNISEESEKQIYSSLKSLITKCHEIVASRGLEEDEEIEPHIYSESETSSQTTTNTTTTTNKNDNKNDNMNHNENDEEISNDNDNQDHNNNFVDVGTVVIKNRNANASSLLPTLDNLSSSTTSTNAISSSSSSSSSSDNDDNNNNNNEEGEDDKMKIALKDEIQAIYRKDITIQIPFLNLLNTVNVETLFSKNVGSESKVKEALDELCSKKQCIPPEKLNFFLGNLLQNYAHFHNVMNYEPLEARGIERNNRICNELEVTLKSIFRL